MWAGALSTLSFTLLLATLAKGSVQTAQACLSMVPGLTVFAQGSPGYAAAVTPFNLRFSPSPGLIVTPTTVAQIQSAVACGFNSSLHVSARSGGHSYAAYALSGDIVVDMSNFKNITMNADHTVVVQTGNRLGDVATTIFAQGKRALPHGSCPYVGTGGHTLYGGFGFLSRFSGGLLLDTVQSAKVVLANGTLVTASASSHPDLFFALRGGGPSFGLVVEWTYLTSAAPPTTVNYGIGFPSSFNIAQATAVYTAWQAFAASAPEALAMAAVLGRSDSGKVSLSLEGNYYGTLSKAKSVLAPLVASVGHGGTLTTKALGWIEGLEAFAGGDGTLNTSAPDGHDTFFAKSLITSQPSSNASIKSWITYLATQGDSTDTNWFAQIDLYGGKISAVASNATAFANRNAFLVYQLYASSSTGTPPYPSDGIAFVNNMLNALEPNPQGAYPNYIDPSLTTEQWQELYFGSNVGRLESIKKSVDPSNVFGFVEGF
ncbi:hypothetical protein BU17DRAFT_37576 [Hysterangium stoloniferum]|nr:hypothetical protein BU17DRAFT_37576 [Hysterangium stoloniferum]